MLEFSKLSVGATADTAVANFGETMEADTISKNNGSLNSPMRRIIILALVLSSLFGAATAQEHVSNIRVQQRDGMIYVTYDLILNADIKVFASLDGGTTYRGPLQHVSGAVGKGISAGNDKVLIWNLLREVGYVDNSSIVIRISANATTSSENSAVISIEKPEHSKYYLGLNGGFSLWGGGDRGLCLGLNGAYFFNHQIGVGFALHHSQNVSDDRIIRDAKFLRKNYFLGPALYGHWGRLNGKIFFPTSIGIGCSWINDYDKGGYIEHSKTWNGLGIFVSGSVAYRLTELISIGLNYKLLINMDDDLININNRDMNHGFTLSVNFHF